MSDKIKVRVASYGPAQERQPHHVLRGPGDRGTGHPVHSHDEQEASDRGRGRVAGRTEQRPLSGRQPAHLGNLSYAVRRRTPGRACPVHAGVRRKRPEPRRAQVVDPARLAILTSQFLSRFQAELRKEGMKETTLACHLRHIPRCSTSGRVPGYALQGADDQAAQACQGFPQDHAGPPARPGGVQEDVAPRPARSVRLTGGPGRRSLVGLWLLGLTLEESLKLSWAEEASFKVDLSGRHPRFRIYAEAEKGHQDRLLPMTPDFVRFLFRTPEAERMRTVFNLVRPGTQVPMRPKKRHSDHQRDRRAGGRGGQPEGREVCHGP